MILKSHQPYIQNGIQTARSGGDFENLSFGRTGTRGVGRLGRGEDSWIGVARVERVVVGDGGAVEVVEVVWMMVGVG
jgi:hypothetical protein